MNRMTHAFVSCSNDFPEHDSLMLANGPPVWYRLRRATVVRIEIDQAEDRPADAPYLAVAFARKPPQVLHE